ncbi:hypothetical protein DFJ63DRAFT_18858 [Scheffersomyces coipomensis]|uniref:uncharacterized protein n=1 Tax=Scheffersomyces coipomensis TaxID=1788519 RepID=UPI00315DFE59
MRLSKTFLLSTLVISSSIAAIVDTKAKEDTSIQVKSGGVAGSSELASSGIDVPSSKSNAKLGVKQIDPEDNHPTPDHLKKPLDPYSVSSTSESEADDDSEVTSYNSFIMSISMIIVSEIGDKTFLIAALMAMRYSRFVVFSSAFSSLAVMTVLSGVVGHALPTLISRRLTQFLAAGLFIVFGAKLLNEGLNMSKDLGVEDELAEVEEEIASSKLNNQMNDIENGASSESGKSKPWYTDAISNFENLAGFVLSPVWIQVFVMTFLGEWGDRSQIATIAMAAGSDYWFVILGAIVGHGICTAAACAGGKLLAKKISMRNVTLGGAIAFFVFSILYFYSAYYDLEG